MRYIGNAFSAAMVAGGATVAFEPVEKPATEWVRGAVSCVGHESTAKLFSVQAGTEVRANRCNVTLQPGDKLLIGQVMGRLPEGVVLTEEQLRGVEVRWLMATVLHWSELATVTPLGY